jgi:hypothetical protein
MDISKIFDFVVEAVRKEEREKNRVREEQESRTRPLVPSQFWIVVQAESLVGPSKKKAIHHREREKVWIEKLQEAEKDLREKGVSIEVFDQQSQTFSNFSGSLVSGAIGSTAQNFQPRVDQKYMDAVKNAKEKMLFHRNKAVDYERYAIAFPLDPLREIKLTICDIDYFGLEAE